MSCFYHVLVIFHIVFVLCNHFISNIVISKSSIYVGGFATVPCFDQGRDTTHYKIDNSVMLGTSYKQLTHTFFHQCGIRKDTHNWEAPQTRHRVHHTPVFWTHICFDQRRDTTHYKISNFVMLGAFYKQLIHIFFHQCGISQLGAPRHDMRSTSH